MSFCALSPQISAENFMNMEVIL